MMTVRAQPDSRSCGYGVSSLWLHRVLSVRNKPHHGVNVTGKNDAEGAEACINAIRELAKKVDIPAGLRDLNVKEEDFAVLATNALKDACGFTNPIQATHEEIVAIYRAAM